MIKTKANKFLKRVFLISGLFLASNSLYAQLDSVSVSSITFSQDIEVDSLGVSDTLDVMNVQVTVNDFDFVGEMIVTVFNANSNYPLYRTKYTRQEAIDAGIVTDDTADVSLYNVAPTGSFRVETVVRNYQGANLPKVITDYN